MNTVTYYIYEIVCKKNGKRYIGSTCRPESRKNTHLKKLQDGTHNLLIQRDFDEFGVDEFEFNILEKSDTFEYWRREAELQEKFNTYDFDYGYNFFDHNNPMAVSEKMLLRVAEALGMSVWDLIELRVK